MTFARLALILLLLLVVLAVLGWWVWREFRTHGTVSSPHGPLKVPSNWRLRQAQWEYEDTQGLRDIARERQLCGSRWESYPPTGHYQHRCGLFAGHEGECRCLHPHHVDPRRAS